MTVEALAALVGSAAESIDPAPITAWLVLIATAFVIIAGVCTGIAFGWKFIAMPQIERKFDERLDNVEDDLRNRIDREAKARAEAINRVHARIDDHIANRHT